ncbi:MAG: hypothetical protein PHF35_04395 [Candidatus Moranbacteria bacterium]|nr:hypothetical protein [Candidatus Moranbacteria bacterium]
MVEIIKFDPARRKEKEKTEKKEQNPESESGGLVKVDFKQKKEKSGKQVLGSEFDSLKKFLGNLGESNPTGLTMRLLFEGIRGVEIDKIFNEVEKNTKDCSQESLIEMKEIVQFYSDEDLIHHFTTSNSIDWHKKPAFYRAILEEVKERMQMLTRD